MKIFVGGLPFGTVEISLRTWFEKWGITVLSLSIPREGQNGGRPYCFLTVPKEQGSTTIKMLNGKSFGTEETGYEIISLRESHT